MVAVSIEIGFVCLLYNLIRKQKLNLWGPGLEGLEWAMYKVVVWMIMKVSCYDGRGRELTG